MRVFLAVISVSLVIGAIGVWTLVDAASQYTSTLRTYTQLEIRYEPNSFVWLDPEFNRGRATIVFTNNSPANAQIDAINLNLLFDGEFAGSDYGSTGPLDIVRGESESVEVEFQVTSRSIQARGGSAVLGLGGSVVVRFSGIERDLGLRVRGTIGQVSAVEAT